jgi:ankyrin repeat protein
MLAAAGGNAAAVRWLVDQGATLDRTAKYGLSALMLAVVRGHAEVVRILVDAGADRTLRGTGAPGFADRTALDLAVARGDRELAELLSRSRSL